MLKIQNITGYSTAVIFCKNSKTRSITDGFGKNNVNCRTFREIYSIIPHFLKCCIISHKIQSITLSSYNYRYHNYHRMSFLFYIYLT